MLYLEKGQIVIKSSQFSMEEISDICENIGVMELDYSESNESKYIATMETNYDIDSVESLIELLAPLIEVEDVDVLIKATFTKEELHESMDVEVKCKDDDKQYRETQWYVQEIIDSDLTFEEYEEEGYNDMTEEEFDIYSHNAKSGVREVNTRGKFSRWMSLD